MNAWIDKLLDMGLTADAECWQPACPEELQTHTLRHPSLLTTYLSHSRVFGSGDGYGSGSSLFGLCIDGPRPLSFGSGRGYGFTHGGGRGSGFGSYSGGGRD